MFNFHPKLLTWLLVVKSKFTWVGSWCGDIVDIIIIVTIKVCFWQELFLGSDFSVEEIVAEEVKTIEEIHQVFPSLWNVSVVNDESDPMKGKFYMS